MILVQNPLNLEKSADVKPSTFRIKASQKAFAILSSGLYSDKVSSTIRELSTNAADAHIAAGNKESFTVHLPNTLEPFFSVKDNGTGLSEHHLNTLYTTYFESDKTHSNDFTGCLGLGSKSPFSYTDQFTVESRFNGNKYTYSCFIDQDGLPSIAKMGEEVTEESNGLEVKFAVKSSDFWEFQNKASNILSWFNPQPNVVGVAGFELTQREYIRKTDKYALRKEKHYGDASRLIMGNVAYKLSTYSLGNKVSLDELDRQILDWGCEIFVPIGTVEVTANREDITYTENSAKVIKECLAEAVKDVRGEIDNMIASAPTIWEARRVLHDSHHSIIGKIKNLTSATWNGQEIHSYVSSAKWNEKNPDKEINIQFLRRKKERFAKSNGHSHIHADNKPIYVNDLGHGGYTRVLHDLNKKRTDEAYLLQNNNVSFLEEAGLKEIVIRASSLPKPESKRSYVPRRKGVRAQLNRWVESHSYKKEACSYWQPADVDLEQGGIYVEMSYYKYTLFGNEGNSPDGLESTISALSAFHESEDGKLEVFGIRSADKKILEKMDNWISLDDYIKEVVEANEYLDATIKMNNEWTHYRDNLAEAFFNDDLSEKTLFGRYVEYCKKAYKAHSSESRAYIRLCGLVNKNIGTGTKLKEMRDELQAKYPLISFLSSYDTPYNSKTFKAALLKYVKE